MSTPNFDSNSTVRAENGSVSNGRRRIWIRAAAILVGLTFVLLLTSAVSPVPGQAAGPGENGKFVVTIDYQIFVMDADGNNRKQLTDIGANAIPTWSPDGRKIAFISNRDGNQEIYVMDADGSNQTRLTNTEDNEWTVSWSPNGNKLAFTRGNNAEGDDFEIYVMETDSHKEKRLTDNEAEDSGPMWSPDGKWIAFTSKRDGNYEIYVMKSNGKDQRNLTNNSAQDGFFYPGPSWSPDSKQIAFASLRDDPDCPDIYSYESECNWEIYVMKADGSKQTNLTHNPATDAFSVWSADGQKIAFISNRDDNQEIYVMKTNGKKQTRLTDSSEEEYAFDWQSRRR